MAIDVERIVNAHQQIKTARADLARKFEDKDNELKAQQVQIENFLLAHLNANKMESMRTTAGTVYRELEFRPSCQDWAAFHAWIAANDAFDFLEKRITKTQMKAFMEENDGATPPGTQCLREYVVRVRKPREKAGAPDGQ